MEALLMPVGWIIIPKKAKTRGKSLGFLKKTADYGRA
jgi:hypothetical protein